MTLSSLCASSITVAPPNLEVIMSYIILFDRQFVPLSGPNSRRTRTEHVQNEGCFFGEKGACNCNARIAGPMTRSSEVRHSFFYGDLGLFHSLMEYPTR